MENSLSKVNLPDFIDDEKTNKHKELKDAIKLGGDFLRETEHRDQMKINMSILLADCLYFGIVDQVNWDKIDKAVEQIRLGGR